jgi:hypothetical protein
MLGLGLGLTFRPAGASVTVPDPSITFRADTGVTKDGSNNVTAWASLTAVDSLPNSSGPTWIANDAGFNNQPVVSFDGVSDYIFGPLTSTIASASPFTIIVAASCVSGAVLDSNDANRVRIGATGGSTIGSQLIDGAATLDSGVAIGASARVIAATFGPIPSLNSIAVDQGTVQASSTTSGSSGLASLILGATSGAGAIGVTKIAEVRIYAVALSAAQRLSAMQSMGTRYGVTVGA